jgi:hypothetical protein
VFCLGKHLGRWGWRPYGTGAAPRPVRRMLTKLSFVSILLDGRGAAQIPDPAKHRSSAPLPQISLIQIFRAHLWQKIHESLTMDL